MDTDGACPHSERVRHGLLRPLAPPRNNGVRSPAMREAAMNTKATPVRIARCACGGLTLTAQGEPDEVYLCSCLDCQRRSGGTFSYAALFPASAAEIAGELAARLRLRTLDPDGVLPDLRRQRVFPRANLSRARLRRGRLLRRSRFRQAGTDLLGLAPSPLAGAARRHRADRDAVIGWKHQHCGAQ